MKDVIVVGGGLSGLQAAVFTAKAGEETVVIDEGESLVLNTSNIQNLIGHDSVSGKELLESGRKKLETFDGKIVEQKAVKVERIDGGLRVKTEKDDYQTGYLIVASAGSLDYLDNIQLDYEDGVEGPYMMDKHVKTDDSNKAAERIYVAGLANSWEYQTATALGDGARAAVNLLSEKYDEPYTDHDT